MAVATARTSLLGAPMSTSAPAGVPAPSPRKKAHRPHVACLCGGAVPRADRISALPAQNACLRYDGCGDSPVYPSKHAVRRMDTSISVLQRAMAYERPRSRAVWRSAWRDVAVPSTPNTPNLRPRKPDLPWRLIAGSADVHIGPGERPCTIATEKSSQATRRLPVRRSHDQSR